MDAKQRIQLFEEDSKTLEAVANRYGEASREYDVIKRAAMALFYVLTECHEQFKDHVMRFEGELTPEQRSHLIAMGIDPDSDPGSDPS